MKKTHTRTHTLCIAFMHHSLEIYANIFPFMEWLKAYLWFQETKTLARMWTYLLISACVCSYTVLVCSFAPSSSSILSTATASQQCGCYTFTRTSNSISFIKPIVQSARASVVVRTSYRLDVGFYCSHFTKHLNFTQKEKKQTTRFSNSYIRNAKCCEQFD